MTFNRKMENGITLVALVITVIILLILAGVAMSLITGQNGLFARANQAGYKYNMASQEEKDKYDALDDALAQYVPGVGDTGNGEQNPAEQSTVHEPVAPEPTTFRSTVNATNVTLTVMPEYVGADGTTYQYQIDGGAWVSPVIATETTYTFTGLEPVSQHTVNVKIGDTAQTAQIVKTGSQKTMKEVTTLIDAIKYSASAISATDTTYIGTYKELTTSDGTVKIPVGFTVAPDSAITVAGGIVVEDYYGNQWVWIPVNSNNRYDRRAYSSNVKVEMTPSGRIKQTSSVEYYYMEDEPVIGDPDYDLQHGVGGYYIGRFESGSVEDTAEGTMRTAATEAKTVCIKRNQIPYTYIAYNAEIAGSGKGDVITLSNNMSSVNGYKTGIVTRLSNSYAWDTAINFIGKTVPGYGSSSPQGNYKNTAYNGGTTQLMRTGLTTSVCNIFDMGGNCMEFSTESTSDESCPVTYKGGAYNGKYADRSAGYRMRGTGGAYSEDGFRVTLFL